MSKIDRKAGACISGIPSVIFRECSESLKEPLTFLFNRCLIDSEIPCEWKTAIVRPHYKGKGEKLDPDSYRPISVLPPIAKVFESLLADRISAYFESNKLFCQEQFGFRKGLSCEHALNYMVDDWRLSLDNHKSTLAIFLDLRKAFDTVDHTILASKLRLYGLSDSLVILINYLLNRHFLVRLGSEFSDRVKSVLEKIENWTFR